MMAAAVAGATFGAGAWILITGSRRRGVPLAQVNLLLERPIDAGRNWGAAGPRPAQVRDGSRTSRLPGARRIASGVAPAIDAPGSALGRYVSGSAEDRAITGIPAIELGVMCAYGAAAGFLAPVLAWVLIAGAKAASGGGGIGGFDATEVLAATIACGLVGGYAPLVWHRRRASELRHEFRVSLSTFVDLVVLALAGGTGVEGALVVASESSGHWGIRRIGYALAACRAGGVASWTALDQLGRETAVGELRELAAALELAGTEGSKVRSSLAARAESMRRHQLADAERDANAATERMFLPGALLLVGFLLFIGYPAFARIVTGF